MSIGRQVAEVDSADGDHLALPPVMPCVLGDWVGANLPKHHSAVKVHAPATPVRVEAIPSADVNHVSSTRTVSVVSVHRANRFAELPITRMESWYAN